MIKPQIARCQACTIVIAIAAALSSVLTSPAAAQEKPKRTYVDEDYGFKVASPGNWQRASPSGISVPGEVCRVWSPGQTSTIVIFMQKPNQAVSPRYVLDASAKAMKTSLGSNIQEQEVKEVAGMRAMWLLVTGKGTGGALDGKGNVRTSQRWVAIPREKDIIVLLLTAPEAEFKHADEVFQAMLKTLEVTGKQTAEQKAAK
jgi:hypothetical protein